MQNFHLQLPPVDADSSSSDHWYSSHEVNYAAEVRVRTLLGRITREGAEPSSMRDKEIYRILDLNEVTEVEALYKTLKPRFVLIGRLCFKMSKCRILCSFGRRKGNLALPRTAESSDVCDHILLEYISCRVVELPFANFGEVERVFYGTHTFNHHLWNGKRHVRIFPTGGDPKILPWRITFPDGIYRDVL